MFKSPQKIPDDIVPCLQKIIGGDPVVQLFIQLRATAHYQCEGDQENAHDMPENFILYHKKYG
jgi:hypothetical protein